MRRKDVVVAGVLGIGFATLSLFYLFTSTHRNDLLVLLVLEIAGGREASLPGGLARGLPWREAAVAATLIELTALFVLFPLLVALAGGLHRVRWLESLLARAQAYAKKNPDVDVLALGALSFMPFLPVGALTSALIGEMLRLPSRYLLPVLAISIVVANVLTAYALARLIALFPRPELVAGSLTVALLAGAGIAALVHRWRRRRALPRIG